MFTSAGKLFRVLNKKYPKKFTKHYILKWLNGIDSFSTQKQVRHKFSTPKVLVTSINEQFDADLTSVANISKDIDGIQFLLFVLDIFSKFIWVRALRNKSAKTVLMAIKDIFKEQKPLKFRSDAGSEFTNKLMRKHLKENHIYQIVTENRPKANYVERVQKTFKQMLYRFLRHRRNYRYIDNLQDLVRNYNSSPHRSLNYVSPKDVNTRNESDLWAFMYLKPQKSKQIKPFRFKVGDFVRISYIKHPFRRSYQQQFITEIFKIRKGFRQNGVPIFKLSDYNDQSISGQFFSAELSKVSKAKNLFFIEKVLKKIKRQGRIQFYVKWEGYPKSMNSWVDKSEVKDVKS